jgi:4-phosphopantoate--beta-alanine ligase
MTRVSRSHPRYHSLVVRSRLAKAAESGLVVPEGLIAHGRGEAFDYFLGERSSPSARRAERVAAQWLARARHPVVSVNGNVAALASDRIARLVRLLPGLGVEVNLFHRTRARIRLVAEQLRRAGVRTPLGTGPTRRIPGLPSDRALVDPRGILVADVCLVPLEDGDRTEALQALGKRVIAIDLNPLSRTSQQADLPIIDDLVRALDRIATELRRIPDRGVPGPLAPFDAERARTQARAEMARRLSRPARGRAAVRRPRGTSHRTRRTP